MTSGKVGPAVSYESALREQLRVIYALMLRDARTRFGRTFAGFLVMVLWPLSHAMFLLLGYVLVHRVAPVGTDPAVFIGTGVLPYILCIYPARETMMCLVANGPLLTFPIVKVSDIIIARGLLQSIVAFWVALLFSLIMYLFDVDVYPRRPEEAALATVVSIYFGFSIGFIAAVLYKVFRPWLAIQVGLLILMYFTAGIVILPTSVPQPLRDYLWFNPMLHQVEWLRSAYYDDFGQGMLSKEYLIGFATVVLLLGLSAERALRGKLQQPS